MQNFGHYTLTSRRYTTCRGEERKMMNETIDPLQLREWVYERLRQGKTGSQELQLSDIALDVRGKAVAAGILPPQRYTVNYDIPSVISEPMRGIIWELIIQGIIIPGVGLGR